MRHRLRPLLAAALLLLTSAGVADAQRLVGRVVDAESGAPVAGAIVKAIGDGGGVVAGTLTDDRGAFSLAPPAGSTVAEVLLERIGYAPTRFPPARFADPAGTDVTVEFSPVALEGLVVTARSLCGPDARGRGAIQVIWEEARKSLEVAALSQSERIDLYETQNFVRRLGPLDRTIRGGTANRRMIRSAYPYRSITIEHMTERGWVEVNGDGGMSLYAPDASVLLTDEFARQHCFEAEVTDEAILLRFTPNRDRRNVPELEGALVLDPRTAELTELRFSYVGLPGGIPEGGAGGEIRFFAAPNGMRIVQEWAIRAPVMRLVRTGIGRSGAETLRVDYVHEEGGRILAVQTGAGRVELPSEALEVAAATPDGLALARERVPSMRPNGAAGTELLLRNDGATPFQVTSIRLRACANTELPCGEYPVDVVVQPGETQVLFRVRPRSATEPHRFEWEYLGAAVGVAAEVIAESGDPTEIRATTPGRDSARPDADVLLVDDIDDGRFNSAYEAIQALRPGWLRPRASYTRLGVAAPIRVVVDSYERTTIEALHGIPIDWIERIEWYDAASATQRWGTGFAEGAILLTTRRGP